LPKLRFALSAAFAVCATAALAQTEVRNDDVTPRQAVRESQEAIPQRQFDKPFPTGMNWVAVSLNGKPLNAASERPSFVLDEQMRARGYGGCNNFSVVAYPLKQQKLIVGPIAHTKGQCDKNAATQERAFFVALRTANHWDYEAGKLVIKGQGGLIRFERGI
jgi:heat shock protein HslJ